MTSKEIAGLLAINKAVFPFAYKDMPKEEKAALLNTWCALLKNQDTALIQFAFNAALKVCKTPVTPADIFEQIRKVEAATEKSDEEIWDEFLTASQLVLKQKYYDDKSFKMLDDLEAQNKLLEELHPVIKQFCINLSALKDYGAMGREELNTYTRPQFLKNAGRYRERVNTIKEIPPELLGSNGLKQLARSKYEKT